VLAAQPRIHPWVFTNAKTEEPYKSVRKVFEAAVGRAGIATRDITLHTLRHTALSRMIASGFDTFTVMSISGHSSTRMLERYTHPTEARKVGALDLPWMVTTRSQNDERRRRASLQRRLKSAELLKEFGGPQEDRTVDLRIANASGSRWSTR
jgi:hypothetical protein